MNRISKRMKQISLVGFFLCMLLVPSLAGATVLDSAGYFMTSPVNEWELDTEVSFNQIEQYGTERVAQLNRLLKHYSFYSVKKDNVLTISLRSDKNAPITAILDQTEETVYFSWLPEFLFHRNTEEDEQTISDDDPLRWMDYYALTELFLHDGYQFFEAAIQPFAPYTNRQAVQRKIKNAGTATTLLTVSIPADIAEGETLSGMISEAASDRFLVYLQRLCFRGRQVVEIYLDSEDRIIRVAYRGRAGLSPDSMRNISIDWRCLREDSRLFDSLQIKTPSLTGSDRNNLILTRTWTLADGNEELNQSVELDLVRDRKRVRTSSVIDLTFDGSLSGSLAVEFINDQKIRYVFTFSDVIKNNKQYKGKLEFLKYSGKILLRQGEFRFTFSLQPDSTVSFPDLSSLMRRDMAGNLPLIEDGFMEAVFRSFLKIPFSDLEFISEGITPVEWEILINDADGAMRNE